MEVDRSGVADAGTGGDGSSVGWGCCYWERRFHPEGGTPVVGLSAAGWGKDGLSRGLVPGCGGDTGSGAVVPTGNPEVALWLQPLPGRGCGLLSGGGAGRGMGSRQRKRK